jgi:hypothetical protein
MKAFIALVLSSIVLCSFGEEQQEPFTFSTLAQCKNYSRELIEKFDSASIQELYVLCGLATKEDVEKESSLETLSKAKAAFGEFKYSEEVGTSSLGSYLKKLAIS